MYSFPKLAELELKDISDEEITGNNNAENVLEKKRNGF